MLILVVCLFHFATALALVVLRVTQPNVRYAWLVAVGGAALAFVGSLFWLAQTPFILALPAWQPQTLFPTPVLFSADGISWAPAVAITTLVLSVLLTSTARQILSNSLAWAGTLLLGGMGILAVSASNPLTLLLVWAFLDLTELATQLGSVDGMKNSERVTISFATRALGIGFLLWSYIESFTNGNAASFQFMPSSAGIYLVIAAGLRLGVLPLHLPYASESSLRRGFGTSLRLIGAVSTLGVLGRVGITSPGFTPVLMFLSAMAGIYGGWMWLRAPDELNGRPYWMIGIASLSVTSALSGNPIGAVAWGCAMVLVGGALFLFSAKTTQLSRALLAGAWSISTLPFSLTAGAGSGNLSIFTPLAITAQSLIAAGYIRHALRATGGDSLDGKPGWTKATYTIGIGLLIAVQILLGLIGWEGARQTGNWIQALFAAILTLGLVWGTRRFRILNPVHAHWVTTAGAGVNSFYQWFWSLYRGLARLGQAVTEALEGEGGIMWTLLFLLLFISIIAQGSQ